MTIYCQELINANILDMLSLHDDLKDDNDIAR